MGEITHLYYCLPIGVYTALTCWLHSVQYQTMQIYLLYTVLRFYTVYTKAQVNVTWLIINLMIDI